MKTPILTDEQILVLIQAKDKRGFDYLYDNYSIILYSVILKIVKDNSLAEDVLQNAFIKIWTNSSSYDISKGSLFIWILNIVKNKAIDELQAQSYKSKISS